MLQSPGNLHQQGRIDTSTLEYIVHIGAVATKLVCEPRNGTTLPMKLLFYYFSNVHHEYKKGGTIRNLFYPGEPPSTLHTNKHEQFTPNKDVNLHLLIPVCFKLAVFRTENKSKSSNIFTNKYEWKRYSKCLFFYIKIIFRTHHPPSMRAMNPSMFAKLSIYS